eukprot:CAMPEP_0177738104 /NCGR_PEP_ID=MMETSP0484_2-20121128/26265_1 /TAXON_ID=354590 /ORGANISM="Rhodomonas lens, Strain RHODO" /LENGTH=102 /DNA_ID=CAMNT_0019251979 /DNA_START=173 /DNA_END=481 /DNA_ORIENTATION=+
MSLDHTLAVLHAVWELWVVRERGTEAFKLEGECQCAGPGRRVHVPGLLQQRFQAVDGNFVEGGALFAPLHLLVERFLLVVEGLEAGISLPEDKSSGIDVRLL